MRRRMREAPLACFARLGKVHVEGVDFLDATVTKNEWRIVWSEAEPLPSLGDESPLAFEAQDLIEFVISNADAKNSPVSSGATVEVYVL